MKQISSCLVSLPSVGPIKDGGTSRVYLLGLGAAKGDVQGLDSFKICFVEFFNPVGLLVGRIIVRFCNDLLE